MRLKRYIGILVLAVGLAGPAFAVGSTAAETAPTQTQKNAAFVEGRNAAYRHALNILGMSYSGPSSMPIGQFYARPQALRAPYVSGAVYGLAHVASISGEPALLSCYRSIAADAPKILDVIWQQGAVSANRNVVAVIRSFCLSDAQVQNMARR